MATDETLLRWDLSRTSERRDARFVDDKDYLRLFSLDTYSAVEDLYKGDHGKPFMNGEDRSVVFHAGKWCHPPFSKEANLTGLLFFLFHHLH